MPKLKLLILDAGVVIRLHELGIWKQVRDRCDIFLSRIVVEREVLFQPGDEGEYGDGEAESLVYLTKQPEKYLISSGDAIVFRVLGNLGRGDQGLSLEEVLKEVGLGRKLDWPYSEAFRTKYTRDGETDMIQGKGRKP